MQAEIDLELEDPTPDLIEGLFSVPKENIFVRCCCSKRDKDDPAPNQVIEIYNAKESSKDKDNREEEAKNQAMNKNYKTVVYDYRSLYCLHADNSFRKELVNFACSTMFENFIILLIFMNSIILAVYDYNDRDNRLPHNQLLERIGQVFTILFAIEMVLKILAQGFIIHYNAYLRDAWNWLDFVVVVTGIMEMMELSWFKVRALRTLRVLRPLRSIKAFPKMR